MTHEHDFHINEGQRQALLLAIGRLAVERPGWDWMLGEIADTFHGREMFERFKVLKREELPPRAEIDDQRVRELVCLHGESQKHETTPECQKVFADTVLALGELARYRGTDEDLMKEIATDA